jgi:hypothetical protein
MNMSAMRPVREQAETRHMRRRRARRDETELTKYIVGVHGSAVPARLERVSHY